METDPRVEAAARALYEAWKVWGRPSDEAEALDFWRGQAAKALAAADAVDEDVIRAGYRVVKADRDLYREALERIAALYVGGASAGQLADAAREALGGGDD